MNETLTQNLELFIKNTAATKQAFSWTHSQLHPLCAGIYTVKKESINDPKIKECRKIVKEKAGMFSQFKGTSLLVFSTFLSLEKDPEATMDEALRAYDALKEGLSSSSQLPFISITLATMPSVTDYTVIANKAKELYQSMKQTHPFLTNRDDYFDTVLLSLLDLPVSDTIVRAEKAFHALKEYFTAGNPLQATSHVLAMGDGDPKGYAEKVSAIYQLMQQKGLKIGKGMQMASIGTLALLNIEADEIASQLVEVHDKLKSQKGFGPLSMDKAQRIMFAAMLISGSHSKEDQLQNVNTGLVSSRIVDIILAQQVAVIAAVIVVAAANTSSSS